MSTSGTGGTGSIGAMATFLKENNDFLLATHISPEGDAFGSAIALSMALEAMGKKTIVFDRDPVPEFYCFMPGTERLTASLEGVETSGLSLVLLDCNEPERAAVEGCKFKNTAVVDHHRTSSGFGDVRWIDPAMPATGLMVYLLIKELGLDITPEMATNLYTAIVVDTGTFRYANTTPGALRAAADLLEAGAEAAVIIENLYESWSQARFRLLSAALGSVEITNKVAIAVITEQMFKDTGAAPDDTENFPGFPRMIKDLKVSALFRQVGADKWKASLRSKKDFNVARIAEGFGGGGHKNAAGYRFSGTIKEAKAALLQAVATSSADEETWHGGGRCGCGGS